jgi:hypothetical protein
MYKNLIVLLLIAVCAGCAHRTKSNPKVALAPASDVEEMMDASLAAPSLTAVIPQFSRGEAPVLISMQPAYSMHQALPNVQKLTRKPVVAMTQYKNWYWYATDVSRDPDSRAIQAFLGGYAVQKGGYLAWKW